MEVALRHNGTSWVGLGVRPPGMHDLSFSCTPEVYDGIIGIPGNCRGSSPGLFPPNSCMHSLYLHAYK